MRPIKIFFPVIIIASLLTSGCTHKKEAQNNDGSISTDTSDVTYPEIIPSSDNALNAPSFLPGQSLTGPLELLDSHNPYMTATDIDNAVPTKNGDRWMYTLMWRNPSKEDTVFIKSVEFQDDYFDIQWNARDHYIPELSTGCWLWTDSVVAKKDYKIIITYQDEKYPPQVFHVNFYPDMASYNEEKNK